MSRTTQGIVGALLPLAVLVLDTTLGLGLPAEARAGLWLAVLGGCGLGAHGLQRRIPRGTAYARSGRVPKTITKAAVEEVLRTKRRKEPVE